MAFHPMMLPNVSARLRLGSSHHRMNRGRAPEGLVPRVIPLLRQPPPFAEGSFETRRNETVKPSNW